jgi:YidC/Oxa1 family membrane protein insertase
MDRRTILAIALSALILIFVPMLMQRLGLVPNRTPAPGTGGPSSSAPPGPGGGTSGGTTAGTAQPVPGTPGAPAVLGAPAAGVSTGRPSAFANAVAAPERSVHVSNDLYEADFDSRGARLVGISLRRFKSAAGGLVRLDGSPTLTLELSDQPAARFLADAVYDVSESTDASGQVRRLRFAAADTGGVRITQTYTFDPGSYVIGLEVSMEGVVQRGFTDYQLGLRSWAPITERNAQEDLNNLQTVSLVGKDVRRHRFGELRKGTRSNEGAILWTAVRSKYFTVAVIPGQTSSKSVRAFVPQDVGAVAAAGAQAGQPRVAASLVLPVPPSGMTHRLQIYAGPTDYWGLEKVGSHLQDVVDLGWPWLLPFSRAILKMMVFIHRFIANYGIVIVVLSVLVKLVFHPLTASSLRSMRAMQRIQPEVEKIRKRYEKDPQKLNQAVFALYKENKVSPLGGCLPMLVQMPVLFSLYQVFLHAIELRQAPFMLWIQDLSAPDVLMQVAGFPIRVLPLIMFGSALLQQKLTPTDPRQVTSMYIMNLFMVVLFYNLPSGLVLYWTVTNLLTAAQQYLVTHGERSREVQSA